MSDHLPKYSDPPVIETVLGISFSPLASWQIPHFGLFWDQIRKDYDKFAIQPPLPDELETFGNPGLSHFTINIGLPQHRCWFLNDEEGWLIQVQNSRFISNWQKKASGPYPNYSKFQERFERDWERFRQFLKKESLEDPQLTQAEVSYINHIDIDLDYEKIRAIFPILSGFKKGEFLPIPSGFVINTIYTIGEGLGRLHIIGQLVTRHSDMKQVVQLTVTAKILIASNTNEAAIDALKLGHEWVVRGFTDFTSATMHERWKRTQ